MISSFLRKKILIESKLAFNDDEEDIINSLIFLRILNYIKFDLKHLILGQNDELNSD